MFLALNLLERLMWLIHAAPVQTLFACLFVCLFTLLDLFLAVPIDTTVNVFVF